MGLMVLAIILGLLSGVVGFIPLVIALARTKHNPQTGNFAPMAKLLLGLFASFAVLIICAILFIAFDKPSGLPFALAEALALSISAIAYGIHSHKVRKKSE